jgi:hypothetical protein
LSRARDRKRGKLKRLDADISVMDVGRQEILVFSGAFWRLRPSAGAEARGYLRIRLGDGERLLPTGGGLVLLLCASRQMVVQLPLGEGEFESVGWREALVARLRRRFTRLAEGVLHFDGVEIFPEGPRRKTRPYCKQVRYLRGWGIDPVARKHPELIVGWPPAGAEAPPLPSVAVALHLHYADLWPEIETLLRRWTFPFALFVSLTAENPELTARVREAFRDAEIRVVDNCGRDVRPFLLLLEDGAFDPFDLVCKIHGKKSLGVGRASILGDVARRTMFLDLIVDDDQARGIAAMFARDPQLGIVGSSHFFTASRPGSRRDLLGRNRSAAEAIAERMKAPIRDDDFDFFDGTMFWVRPQAMAPLRRLRLSESFPPADTGLGDGSLEHAVERLFNHAARAAGYRVEAVAAR